MEMSVSSEMTFFTTKQQSEICPHLRTGSSAEDRGRIDTMSATISYNILQYIQPKYTCDTSLHVWVDRVKKTKPANFFSQSFPTTCNG